MVDGLRYPHVDRSSQAGKVANDSVAHCIATDGRERAADVEADDDVVRVGLAVEHQAAEDLLDPRFAADAVLHRPRGFAELNAVHSNERLQRHAAEEAATGQGSHLVVPLGLGEQAA